MTRCFTSQKWQQNTSKGKKKIWFWLCFDILSDPKSSVWTYIGLIYHFIRSQKRKTENVFSPPVGKRGDGKSFEKGKSDRKRGEKAKKAAGGDSSRLIPPSGFRPLRRRRPAAHFLPLNFPMISPNAIWVKSLTRFLGQKFDPKLVKILWKFY